MKTNLITDAHTVTISGNTYPAAKLLRACGFVFDSVSKVWTGTNDAANELDRVSTATFSRRNQKLVSGLRIAR